MPQVTDAYGRTFNVDKADLRDFQNQIAYEKSLIDGTVFEKYNFDSSDRRDVQNQMSEAQAKAKSLGLYEPGAVYGPSVETSDKTDKTGQFDAEAYLKANPDVAASSFASNPLAHYLKYGMAEGRKGTGLEDFNAQEYLKANPDVAAHDYYGNNALEHYLRHGQGEGRKYFSIKTEEKEETASETTEKPKEKPKPSVPSWLIPPSPGSSVNMAITTYTNPVTGETFDAPTGGYTIHPDVLKKAKESTPVTPTEPTPVAPTEPTPVTTPVAPTEPTPVTPPVTYTPVAPPEPTPVTPPVAPPVAPPPYIPSTYSKPVSTVGLGSVPTFGGGYEMGSLYQPGEVTYQNDPLQNVIYANQRGQRISVTEENGKPITYVPPGYFKLGMNEGGLVTLDQEHNLASKFLGYTGEKSRPALDDFYNSNPGAAARMGKYRSAIAGTMKMAYGGYSGGPAERGRGAPASSPAPKPASRPVPNTPPPSVSSPAPSVDSPTRPRPRPTFSSDRDDTPSRSQQMQRAFQRSTPTTQTEPLRFSERDTRVSESFDNKSTQEKRLSESMKRGGTKYTYTDDKNTVLGEGDSQKSIFDLGNPWVDAFKLELDSENKSYDQVGNKIIVSNNNVESSKNTKFGIYQGKFFIKGQDPIYGNKFEVGLKYNPMSNETAGSFDYSVPFNIKSVIGMNQGGMVRGFQEGGQTTGLSYQEDIVPMFGDVVGQTMQPIQATVDKITPTAEQDISATAGQVSAAAPYAQAATVGTVEQATTPIPTAAATYGATTAAPAVQDVTAATQAATGQVSEEAQVTAAQQDKSAVSDLEAAQGAAHIMENPVQREIQAGELISGAADASKAAKFTEQIEAAQATPSKKATVQGQLEGLMEQFEGGDTPSWAAGAMRAATAAMAARGLGASSLAGQAIVQAAMESALPIAQADAQTVASFEAQNLSNRQQRAMLAAQQRAQFMGQEFDQAFQARVQNSARIGDIANMNFTAEQNIALENSRAVNTMNLANLNNRQAMVMAEAAALSQLDMSNLNNRQQAAVQNAQSFLQMDMANLSNEQQTALFKSQQNIQALFTDQAATNAAAQFNAASENQTNQFFSSLANQTSQFNAAQTNAINQANVNAVNSLRQFNSNMQNQRDQFNATNSLVVAQANAQWRQNLATINTATQNQSNADFAKTINAMTSKNIDAVWQRERDIMSLAFQTAESNADNATSIILQQMAADATITAAELQAKIEATKKAGDFLSEVFLSIVKGGF